MSRLSAAWRQARPDAFTVGLLACLVLGMLLPTQEASARLAAAISGGAIALLFFLHGARLSRSEVIAGAVHWRLHLAVVAATFVAFPLAGLAIAHLPGSILSPAFAAGFLFLCLLPSTVQSSIAFTAVGRGNVAAAICSASLSNLLGVLLTPALVWWLMAIRGEGPPLDTIRLIMVQILFPFLAGMGLQPFLGAWVLRNRRLVTLLDRGCILLVVYSAFAEATGAGLWRQVSAKDLLVVAVLSGILLGAMLVLTIAAARRLGFSREDEIAFAFCGSKKSLASGIPLAGVLFPAASVGIMILPLMVFHQIQLAVCAVIAKRYAEREPPAALIG